MVPRSYLRAAGPCVRAGRVFRLTLCLAMAAWVSAPAQDVPDALRDSVEKAVAKVKPALVRIEVVSTYYNDGRELKEEASGSGVIITKEGHVVTNHHVAGHATRLVCTLANKEEVEADVVGLDPLTDLAVIKLRPGTPREFPAAAFGDSALAKVGDYVLAMGSPLALSQSVTLGIISNAEMILPKWIASWGGITQDGEHVGALVRWIGHDAEINPGNSGGPLVNMQGEIIGINEISIGLGGAIPSSLAKQVSDTLVAQGKVRRSWLGIEVQPRLKHSDLTRGVLVSGTFVDSPAAKAGILPGDLLIRLGGNDVDVKFDEQLPLFNRVEAELPIGSPVELVVLRDGQEKPFTLTTVEREKVQPDEHEIKQWGITVRDLSFMIAREMKRDSQDGVLITSVNAGGPSGDAKPEIREKDILLEVALNPVHSVADLRDVTAKITQGKTEPTPTLVAFERKTERFVTVVKVGIKELEDPGREIQKAWLPAQTQVITRDIAEGLGKPALRGFRVTEVFAGTTAEKAGLKIGDLILAVDDTALEAAAPEDYEELPTLIRQYKIGSVAQLKVLRGADELKIPVELPVAPKLSREMKKYREENFDFTVREVTFMDKATEKWQEQQQGVLVEQVETGGWAALGRVRVGDLILAVDGAAAPDVAAFQAKMKALAEAKPKMVVFRVLRGIHTLFLELEPKWEGKK